MASNLHNCVDALDDKFCDPLDPYDSVDSLPNVFFIIGYNLGFSIEFTISVDEIDLAMAFSKGSGAAPEVISLLLRRPGE